jgi:catechol 2,3-dioxygenase-like lactoylglutathione lyase family enzyme
MNEDQLFKKVGAVILLVSDMEQSIKFYRDTLKLPIKTQSDDWTEFFSSGTVIALHPVKRKANVHSDNSGTLVGFMVSDFDITINKLRERNLKFFKEPKEEPFGKHAIIEDPDGHLISIAQIESKSITEGFDLIGLVGAE